MRMKRLAAIAAALVTVVAAALAWSWWRNPIREVETFIAANSQREIVGVGRLDNLPFDIEIYPLTYVTSEGCDFLDQRHPDLLVVDLTTLQAESPDQVARFVLGEFNYREVVKARADGVTTLLTGLLGSQAPDLAVFERTDRPCLRPEEDLFPGLYALRDREDPDLRSALARAILRHQVPFKTSFGGTEANIQGIGMRFDGWSRGTEPMAVVYSNESDDVLVPHIVVGCQASRADLPVTITVDDGIKRLQRVFGGKGVRRLAFDPLAPGDSRLMLVWSDKAWQAQGGDGRWLGASVLEAELVVPEVD